jgi:ATP-dependent DNA helicase DinG
LAEVPGLDERSPALPLVTSTKDNCLGSDCPKFKACFVNQARREALAADLVVINHHLFFADMAVRESGMAELLPSCRVVIFDEAHKLNDIGVEFSGLQFGTRQLLDFCRDTLAAGLAKARGLAQWNDLVYELEQATRALRMVFLDAGIGNGRIGWAQASPDGVPQADWAQALESVMQALTPLMAALEECGPSAPELARLLVRARELLAGAEQFTGASANDHVRWVEVGAQLRLTEAPLDIAALLRSQQGIAPANPDDDMNDYRESDVSDGQWPSGLIPDLDREEVPQANTGPRKSWIYTSATLGDDPALSWFTQPCGLEAARILTVKSPFDYAAQAGIYIPTQFPKPADPGHSLQVARLASRAAMQLGGRTMVLTTTLRALSTIGDELERLFLEQGQLQVLRQGVSTKRELIERFRAAGQAGRPGCVLVASASFWEGVDIPGEALQLVVIDKLPFPPPHDPLVKARGKRLEEAGRSAFADYFIPEAIVALKQGAGRLIRHENDVGVLVICDTRVQAMGYGRRVLAALPPMQRLASEAVLMDQLDLITRIATSS